MTAASSGTVLVRLTLAAYSLKVFALRLPKRQSMVTCSAKACTWPTLRPSQRYIVTPIRRVIRVYCCSARPSSGSRCRNSYMPQATRGLPRSRMGCFRPGGKAARGPRLGKMRLAYIRILRGSRWYVLTLFLSVSHRGRQGNSKPGHYLFAFSFPFPPTYRYLSYTS